MELIWNLFTKKEIVLEMILGEKVFSVWTYFGISLANAPIKTIATFLPIWSGLVLWEILGKMGKLYFGPANPHHLPPQPCLSKSVFSPGILNVLKKILKKWRHISVTYVRCFNESRSNWVPLLSQCRLSKISASSTRPEKSKKLQKTLPEAQWIQV